MSHLISCAFSFILLLVSCSNIKNEDEDAEKVKDALKAIQDKNIYFGHQSVGFNIMDGLKMLSDKNGVRLRIVPIENAPNHGGGFFSESSIGENGNYRSKCDDFERRLDGKIGGRISVALMKFCYIDFDQGTKEAEMFQYYKAAIDRMKKKYPALVFVHVTAPLVERDGWLKRSVKSLLGRADNTDRENVKRNSFNQLLRRHYKNEPLFDLAKIESTCPDGSPMNFTSNGKTYSSLAPDYTDDGGHLNALGKMSAAKGLLFVLARALGR